MKNPIFWLALVAGNLAAAWIVIWRYTGREHAEAVLIRLCAASPRTRRLVGRVWKLATK